MRTQRDALKPESLLPLPPRPGMRKQGPWELSGKSKALFIIMMAWPLALEADPTGAEATQGQDLFLDWRLEGRQCSAQMIESEVFC